MCRKMNPGRMKRYDRSVRDKGEKKRGGGRDGVGVVVSMSGYVIIV